MASPPFASRSLFLLSFWSFPLPLRLGLSCWLCQPLACSTHRRLPLPGCSPLDVKTAAAGWCTYSRAWIDVEHVYQLNVTEAEKNALGEMLDVSDR
ncbi:hypothetical protein [Streptomyces sp. SID1034]|uniref:hypothetical protein n=1 Tax=Streptomyces sp. SID1034 TaxID=2690248 RepID=UPI00192737D6|nr:hypothetical protein [Streptomyces sp. SID1034]